MYLCGIIIGIFFHELYILPISSKNEENIMLEKHLLIALPKLGQLVKNLRHCI